METAIRPATILGRRRVRVVLRGDGPPFGVRGTDYNTRPMEEPRFYVTTPIYYINAAPHVGSAYTTIVADALARYHRLRGHDTYFLTGTDEHGQKIEKAAAERGVATAEFADGIAQRFKDAWPKLHIAYDQFIRTTDRAHEERVVELWKRVRANGFITLGHYEGWYCVADEAFYTEKELVDGLSPTGRPVERIREPSYFFTLSKLQDRLLAFYEKHPEFVVPEGRFNEVKAFVRGGLEDLSVSRTTFSWGIQVPDDPAHVMYVWFDALANYWTALGAEDDPRRRFWPTDVHLVGKEITRFHCVYWPAFLMAAGFTDEQIPKQVFAHGWLTVNGEKMSKSAGNFLDPLEIAAEPMIGADAFRYYLLRAVALGQDGDFSHEDLIARINSELGNDLGNLVNRTLGMCNKYVQGNVADEYTPTALDTELLENAAEAARASARSFDSVAPHRALDAIWKLCREANTYVDRSAPWKAAAESATQGTSRVNTILATLLEVCRRLSVLVSPVLPEKAAEMRVQLRLPPLSSAVVSKRDEWLADVRPAGHAGLAPGQPLFPRIDDDAKKAILDRLVPKKAAPPPAPASTTTEPSAPSLPITYDDFARIDLRVGQVIAASKVPKKDKLLDLQVDVGEAAPRRIVAGLALSFTPESLVGRRVVVVANLAPRDFGKGLVSHGMLLAAGPSESLSLATVPDGAPVGTRIK